MSEKFTENEIVVRSVYVRGNRNQPIAIKSHWPATFEIDTPSTSDLLKIKRNQNGRFILSDVLYPEWLILKKAHNYLALFSSSTYRVEMTIGAEKIVVHPIISLTDIGAGQNTTGASFLKSQWDRGIKH